MSSIRTRSLSLATVGLSIALGTAALARECGTPSLIESSAKCHAPRDCNNGTTIEIGSFTFGSGGQTSGESCCRVLEFIPAHYGKTAVPEYQLKVAAVSGWTMVGECKPAAISIFGVISLPSGERYCEYSNKMPTTHVSYEIDGYCEEAGET